MVVEVELKRKENKEQRKIIKTIKHYNTEMPPKKNIKKNVKKVPAQKKKLKKPQISHEEEIKKNLKVHPTVIPTEKLKNRNKLETELQEANQRYLQIKSKLESLETQESEIQ